MENQKKTLQGFLEGGAYGLMATIIGLIIGVIGLQIVNQTMYNGTTGTVAPLFGGLLKTVMDNIPILFGVGLLAFSVAWAFSR